MKYVEKKDQKDSIRPHQSFISAGLLKRLNFILPYNQRREGNFEIYSFHLVRVLITSAILIVLLIVVNIVVNSGLVNLVSGILFLLLLVTYSPFLSARLQAKSKRTEKKLGGIVEYWFELPVNETHMDSFNWRIK